MKRSVHPKIFLAQDESERIAAAVAEVEKNTSAEIKVIVLGHAWMDIRDTAARVFRKYGLHQTRERNGVMILLVAANHEFLVYGDSGIHKKVRQDFWNEVRDEMSRLFAEDRFGDGLCAGIRLLGSRLSRYFPVASDDRNEISNEVIVED